ncbi:hypothetical protein BDC45DRAFT_540335 [Circinella umbellata]|nr:hypothetical protein BDC45DRAFT_540335 [Circinella umbellata]
MSDLNWCTYCDNAVNSFSNSIYCSEECLRADALKSHPLLGYDWEEFKDFPRSSPNSVISPGLSSSASSVASASPSLSPVPSYTLPSPGLKGSSHYHRSNRLSPPILELEPLSEKEQQRRPSINYNTSSKQQTIVMPQPSNRNNSNSSIFFI